MTESSVRLGYRGELFLSGVLDFRTGPDLRKQGQELIKSSSSPDLVLDCSAVTKSSSVGMSLLLCFMRDAEACEKSIIFRTLPDEMLEIAEFSGLTEILVHT